MRTREALEQQAGWLRAEEAALRSELVEFGAMEGVSGEVFRQSTNERLEAISVELQALEGAMAQIAASAAEPYLKLHLEGARFEAHGVPLEVMGELQALEPLLRELVRCVHLERHPTRRKLPQGFKDRYRFQVRHIEAGSAVPVVERVVERGHQLDLDELETMEVARRRLLGMVEACARGEEVPADFPREVLRHFKRFGRRLRDGESMRLMEPGRWSEARYDVEVRRRILSAEKTTRHEMIEEDWAREGHMAGVEVRQRRWRLDDGLRVWSMTYRQEDEARLLAALERDRNVGVRVRGAAQFNPATAQLEEEVRVTDLELYIHEPDYGALEGDARGAQIKRVIEASLERNAPVPCVARRGDEVCVSWSWETRVVSAVWGPEGCALVVGEDRRLVEEASVAALVASLIGDAQGPGGAHEEDD